MRMLEDVRLSVDEVEALRLKDLERLEQEEAAGQMNISRQTFQRVLASARQKLADALLNGKAIRVEGGNFEMTERRFRCADDGHEWNVPFETMIGNEPLVCPRCRGPNAAPIGPPFGMGGRGRGCGRGRRGRRWQR